jgi:hypothetical protein
MTRPNAASQAGRILALLESRNGARVYLLEILSLRISQYNARIHDLRHKYGLRIENGSEPGRPDHTWFRLVEAAAPHLEPKTQDLAPGSSLFPSAELERTAQWRDEG